MRTPRTLGPFVATILLVVAPVAAGEGSADRVYTNLDLNALASGSWCADDDEACLAAETAFTDAELAALEPFPVTGTEQEPAPEAPTVSEMLDRAREDLAADRAYELERQRIEAESTQPEPGYVYGLLYTPRVNGIPIDELYRKRHCDRGRHVEPPPTTDTHAPHPRFVEHPPVREHVPGLGDSYRQAGSRNAAPVRDLPVRALAPRRR